MQNLKGRTAIVTGGARGIGREIAFELAKQGCNLVINDICLSEDAKMTCAKISGFDSPSHFIAADISIPEEADRLIKESVSHFNKVDILINNAGIVKDKTLKRMTFKEWDDVMKTNLYSVYNCTRVAVPHLIENGWGRIVSIASVVGQMGAFGQSNYAASKAGIVGFTKSVALETAKHGITINAVSPGYVDTDMLRSIPKEVLDQIVSKVPIGRVAMPNEIARVVRFLVQEGDYITGECINVNGGVFLS